MKKARLEHLYAIADAEVMPEFGEPEVIFCVDEFGPLNIQPHPGQQWADRGGGHNRGPHRRRPRRRATRRTAAGSSRKETLRMLKRYIAREVFTEIRRALTPPKIPNREHLT